MLSWILNYIDHAVTYVKAAIATASFLGFGIVVTDHWLQRGAWLTAIIVGIGTIIKTDSPWRHLFFKIVAILKKKLDELKNLTGRN